MTLFGIPVHPSLVHFPIAFFLGAWFLDCLGRLLRREQFHTAAVTVFVMAAVSALAAGLTGLLEMSRLSLHHPTVYAHRNVALAGALGAWLALGLMWVFRANGGRVRLIFTCACWSVAALIAFAAYLGGEMVYRYGVGVPS